MQDDGLGRHVENKLRLVRFNQINQVVQVTDVAAHVRNAGA